VQPVCTRAREPGGERHTSKGTGSIKESFPNESHFVIAATVVVVIRDGRRGGGGGCIRRRRCCHIILLLLLLVWLWPLAFFFLGGRRQELFERRCCCSYSFSVTLRRNVSHNPLNASIHVRVHVFDGVLNHDARLFVKFIVFDVGGRKRGHEHLPSELRVGEHIHELRRIRRKELRFRGLGPGRKRVLEFVRC